MNQTTKVLLFDLGGVVIDVSFDNVIKRWSEHSKVEFSKLKPRFKFDSAYEQHERGEIEAKEYFASLRDSLGIALSDEQFEEGWNAIYLGEITETVNLLKQLDGEVPLYAFSNTNETHKLFWSEHYVSTLEPFTQIFVSSDMGKRKPEPDAFVHVASEIDISLAEIMFFDDSEENISAAKSLGMQAVLVRSSDDVRHAVETFL